MSKESRVSLQECRPAGCNSTLTDGYEEQNMFLETHKQQNIEEQRG